MGLLLAVSLGASGCQDPNRMFFGVWEAEEALPEGSWLEGRPELSVGHFGTELTGVVRYLDDNRLPTLACLCGFLEDQRVVLDDERFVATSELCDGPLLIWDLRLDSDSDPPRLEGTVTRATQTDDPLEVSFVLLDTFVAEERRECEP
jgi:hypothetical protein